jgi:hypothetical protein
MLPLVQNAPMLDTIEPETKRYLKKVMQTVFVGLFWMFAQVIAGIFFELGFVQNGFSVGNIIYYILFIASLSWLIFYFYKMWKDGK